MDILHLKDLGPTSVISECSLGLNLVIDNFYDVVSSTSSVSNLKANRLLLMEKLHFENLGDTSVVSECSLGVNLVIDIFLYVASGTSPLYKI